MKMSIAFRPEIVRRRAGWLKTNARDPRTNAARKWSSVRIITSFGYTSTFSKSSLVRTYGQSRRVTTVLSRVTTGRRTGDPERFEQ